MLMKVREDHGFTGKDPLFPTLDGKCTSKKALRETIIKVTGEKDASEHSMRRLGAQYIWHRSSYKESPSWHTPRLEARPLHIAL